MINQVTLKEHLNYDPDTGIFTRRAAPRCPKHLIGKRAGNVKRNHYREIRVNGTSYLEHRLAWLYVYGYLPPAPYEIDHINGDRADNRISNLRIASRSLNNQNRRDAQVNNKNGFLGASKHGPSFRARIVVDGKRHELGVYETPEEAHEVYLKAKRSLHARCQI